IGQCRRRAAIGHLLEFDTGLQLKKLGGQMRSRAVALRGARELAGIGLGVGDDVGNACKRNPGIEYQRVRHTAHDDNGDELGRIEAKPRIKVLVDDERRWRRGEQRVPSGSALATGSAPMFPAAPLRFPTTTGPPPFCASQSLKMRGITSAVPPAGNGTMILTAREG